MPRDEPSLMPLLRSVATGRSGLGGARLDEVEVEFALSLGLGPLLDYLAQDDEAALAHADRARIAGADLAGATAHATLTAALGEILDAARDIPEPITLLKGMSICRLYPQPHLRQMGDVDLLVSADSLPQLERILGDLGYRPGDFGMARGFYADHHHTRPFVNPESRVRVEAHRVLFPPHCHVANDSALGIDRVRTRLVASTFEGREVRRLSAELELVYIAAHWAYDMHLPLVLSGLIDTLYLLEKGGDIDWDLVCGWNVERETATPLWVLLGYLGRSGLIELDPRALARLESGPKSVGRTGRRALYRIVDRCLGGGWSEGLATKDVLEIIWRTLLSPSPALANLYAVPRNLAFPPECPDRFSPRFQFRRLRRLLGAGNERGAQE